MQGMQNEKGEDQSLQEILKLCGEVKQGNVQAVAGIEQIVTEMLKGQQAEEGQEGAEGGSIGQPKPDFVQKFAAAKAAQEGGQGA